jgi:hypothetical protein
MDDPEKKMNGSFSARIRYAVIVLAAVLIVLAAFLVRSYVRVRRIEILHERESWFSAVLHQHGPVTVGDVGFVSSWMTFDYVNALFHVPPPYLKERLSISDPRYPRLTIGSYISHNHLDAAMVLGELKGALTDYLSQMPPANTTSTTTR